MILATATLGSICVIAAAALCLMGMLFFVAARRADSDNAAAFGRATVYATFILLTIATLAMVRALLTNDFSVSYVAHVGSRATPRWVSAISLWSSLEGSILFWGWVLCAYSAAWTYRNRATPLRFAAWVGITLLAVQLFFLVVLAGPANPFVPVTPLPTDGPGPNPLLQNHWLMAIHPPFLYLGYIGFTIPFACAVAALIDGDTSGMWLQRCRRWTILTWSFLTLAIMLGAWWSYAVLGWGGYWAWDPVENASFMPWLSATALVHSLIVQERRRLLPVWNLALAIITFLLTVLGTFLTRSGVLESVHSFTESGIGPLFLGFIGVTLIVSVALLLWRGPLFRQPRQIEHLFSLEVLFLFNNLLLISFCFVVFLGTLYPLAVEAVRGARISVGEPYFNQMTVPLTALLLLLLNVGLATPWRRGEPRAVARTLGVPILCGGVACVVAAFNHVRHAGVLFVVFACTVAAVVMAVEVVQQLRQRSLLRLLREQPRRYAGFVAHFGILLVIVGVAFSAVYKQERELTLQPGTSALLGNFAFTLERVEARETPQRFEVRAMVSVMRGERSLGQMTPQLNYYPSSREPIATPAIRSTLVRDIYLAPIHFEKDGSAVAMRTITMPGVVWIWIGGVVAMCGGVLSCCFARLKRAEDAV
ncbi:MAG: heme lyase CcmF/NrfE family subunit [Deltaproteobacteria bacterium]|nr:heme lyase CcmF/NrfE family subunit [Deltaproteobacteria bacterium]